MKYLLDPGHGGVAFGTYYTPGKRSPEVPPGIYEGEFNREVCLEIEYQALWGGKGDEILTIAPGPIQISLKDRIKFVNLLVKKEDVSLISIHANAAGSGWSSANGFTVFTCKNASKRSILLADLINTSLEMEIGHAIKDRGIKRANFAMLKQTKCPAVLVECGFMTNKSDVAFLASSGGQELIATAILNACDCFEEQGDE